MLAQGTSSGDVTLTGVVGVLILLSVAAVIAYGLYKRDMIRHERAWRPVLGMVGGKVKAGVNPNTTVMRGTWKSYPVVCTALPDSPLGPSQDEVAHYNRFIIRLFGLKGAGDWRVVLGRQGWQVEAADPALAARLEAAGVSAAAYQLGLPQDNPSPAMSFSARDRHLELNADAGHGPVPSPAGLEALLDAMLSIARINESVNPA